MPASQKFNSLRLLSLCCLCFGGLLLSSCKKDLFYAPGSVQEELNRAVEGGFDGIIICVNQGNRRALYASGLDQRAHGTLLKPDALFKIASISKLYLAAATCKLIAAKRLSLESTLVDLIPELEGQIKNAGQISLRMLLQHRSGIPDFIYEPEFQPDTDEDYITVASLIFGKNSEFKPDADYGYSNTNYLLIAEIINRCLGYSYQAYIQEEILDPLGLVNTFHQYRQADTNKVVHGYVLNWNAHLRSVDHVLPSGAMVASAEDLSIFLRALIDGSLLSQQEQALYDLVYAYEHTGWIPGYTSIARYHHDIDAVIIQFVNTSGKEIFWLELERVYSRVLRSVRDESLLN